MRRLVIELPIAQLNIKGLGRILGEVESYTLLQRLKQDEEGYVAICRAELRNPKFNPSDFIGQIGIIDIKSIYHEGDDVHVVQVTGKRVGWLAEILRTPDVYQIGPFEIQNGKLKLSFVGKSGEIKKLLARIQKQGLTYRILSLSDAKFSPESPLAKLTDKQRKILVSAYNLGYYDIPRKVDSEELARKLNLVRSTVAEHLRKAELRLVSEAVSS